MYIRKCAGNLASSCSVRVNASARLANANAIIPCARLLRYALKIKPLLLGRGKSCLVRESERAWKSFTLFLSFLFFI